MSIRRVILAAAVIMALPTLALAQTSRVAGMSVPGDYIKDYTGIYTYTSGIVNVGNLVYGELGSTPSSTGAPATGTPGVSDRAVGSVLQNLFDGKFGTWGIHLREITPALGQGDFTTNPNIGNAGFDPNANTNESFDLMWGRKFGTTSLGLRLNRSFFEAKSEPIGGAETDLQFDPIAAAVFGDNLARNLWGFGGGLGFEMNANTNVEVSFLYQSRTYEHTIPAGPPPGTSKTEDDGPSTYMLAARAFYQMQPNMLLVPVFKYYSYDLSQKSTAPVATFDNSLKGWQAGVAGNWTVGNNDLFVLGLAFAQNKVEQEDGTFAIDTDPTTPGIGPGEALIDGKATETIAPEIFSALETHVNNWLTLRFGARKGVYNKLKIEPTAGGSAETSSSPFLMSLGAGVKLGTLQLDAVMNDVFPQTLGGWFSNDPDGIVAFPKVTATYSF